MKHIRVRATLLLLTATLCIIGHLLLTTFSLPMQVSAYAFALIPPTPTPVPTPSPDAVLGFNGNLLVAIATIIAAIIAGVFVVYQVRKNKELTRENERIQSEKEDMQRRLDEAARHRQFEEEIEKSRYGEWLVARREAEDRERQRKLSARTAARNVMVQAHTPAEREEAYRKAIHADPNISQLQILDMAHPMEVAKVYVRLRLHQEAKLDYDIDRTLFAAETHGDPNSLLKAKFSFLEKRTQVAMTPEEALQKYPRCVVLGDPGAGKSTLLKYLTLQSVDKQLPNLPHIPIHIVLSEFATSPNPDLIGFAAQRWDEWYGFPEDEAQAYMESLLDAGSALLLLDALDETVIGSTDEVAKESYSRVLDAIDRVARRYSKAPIIITARKAGYYRRAHMSGFTELEVLDFRPAEIKEFVDNWFKYHPAPPKYATANELNTQLAHNPRMQSLAANPLLLCLIVMVYESRQDLPEKRADIYKQCTETLLFRWDTSRDLRRRRKFKIEDKQKLLVEIAWHFHLQGRRYFPEDELLKTIAAFLPTVNLMPEESRAILSEIEEENGLLKEQAHGWHGFLHLTLQEYFVAQYLSNMPNGLNELLKHCGDPWWEEVMVLYAGSVYDASPLLYELLKMEKRQWLWQDIFHSPLLWAGQCLAAKPRLAQRELRTQILTHLFALLRKTPYSLTREQIVKTLLQIEGNDAKGKLLFLLQDKHDDPVVRRGVAQALGQLADHSVIPALLSILNDKHDDPVVRDYVAQALGQLADRFVIPTLLAILNDKHNNFYVRYYAAQALGQLADRSIIPTLLSILNDKHDTRAVRWNVAQALGQLADHSVIPALLSILNDKHDDPDVRWYIAQALGQLADHSVIPTLLTILNNKQDISSVRGEVARALGQLADHSVIPTLLAILNDQHDDPAVRYCVAQALGQLADRSVIPALLSILNDKHDDPNVRGNVARALGQLADRSVIPALLSILNDKHDVSRVRWNVAEVLVKFGQQESVLPYLHLIINDLASRYFFEGTNIPSEFIWNYASLCAFAQLLKRDDAPVRNAIHRTLWEASQREKVRILIFEWLRIKFVRVVRRK